MISLVTITKAVDLENDCLPMSGEASNWTALSLRAKNESESSFCNLILPITQGLTHNSTYSNVVSVHMKAVWLLKKIRFMVATLKQVYMKN